MTHTLVLGAGIVGRAAVWDLVRRGHQVTVGDADEATALRVAAEMGATAATVDVTDAAALEGLIAGHDVVISAVPYRFGLTVAGAAIAAGAHYLDFGGNPTIVARQRDLDAAARAAEVAVVPDCGLAPGLANVLAEDLIAGVSEHHVGRRVPVKDHATIVSDDDGVVRHLCQRAKTELALP